MVKFTRTHSWFGKVYTFYRAAPTQGEAVRIAGDLRRGGWNGRTDYIIQKNGKKKWAVYRRKK